MSTNANGSGNSSINGTDVLSFSNDVPIITRITRQGNITKVNYRWTPSTDNITGFSILATDDKLGSALYTPNIVYCLCKHTLAKCLNILVENNTQVESLPIEANVNLTEVVTISGNLTIGSNNTVRIKKGISECKLYAICTLERKLSFSYIYYTAVKFLPDFILGILRKFNKNILQCNFMIFLPRTSVADNFHYSF